MKVKRLIAASLVLPVVLAYVVALVLAPTESEDDWNPFDRDDFAIAPRVPGD